MIGSAWGPPYEIAGLAHLCARFILIYGTTAQSILKPHKQISLPASFLPSESFRELQVSHLEIIGGARASAWKICDSPFQSGCRAIPCNSLSLQLSSRKTFPHRTYGLPRRPNRITRIGDQKTLTAPRASKPQRGEGRPATVHTAARSTGFQKQTLLQVFSSDFRSIHLIHSTWSIKFFFNFRTWTPVHILQAAEQRSAAGNVETCCVGIKV